MPRRIMMDAPDALAETARVLDSGNLAVVPTDTQYALAADALDEEAVLRIFAVKRRAPDVALPVCVDGIEGVHHVATLTPLARMIADRYWPGPVTLVLRAKAWLPDALTGGLETVAVRCPGLAFDRELARRVGPFVVTSANRHGEIAASNIVEAETALGDDVALYVDGGALPGIPSTIVDATGREAKVLREGAVRAAEIVAHEA